MIKPLTEPFKLNIQHASGLHFITFNGVTTVLNDIELENLQCGLTDMNHAILMYNKACNASQEAI
jgi:hypothetical protein